MRNEATATETARSEQQHTTGTRTDHGKKPAAMEQGPASTSCQKAAWRAKPVAPACSPLTAQEPRGAAGKQQSHVPVVSQLIMLAGVVLGLHGVAAPVRPTAGRRTAQQRRGGGSQPQKQTFCAQPALQPCNACCRAMARCKTTLRCFYVLLHAAKDTQSDKPI